MNPTTPLASPQQGPKGDTGPKGDRVGTATSTPLPGHPLPGAPHRSSTSHCAPPRDSPAPLAEMASLDSLASRDPQALQDLQASAE